RPTGDSVPLTDGAAPSSPPGAVFRSDSEGGWCRRSKRCWTSAVRDPSVRTIPFVARAPHAGSDRTFSGGDRMDRLLLLSDELAGAVQQAARAVVAVHGRPRVPSTGIHWRSGLIVTASHTVQTDDDLTVTSPSGQSVPAAV